MEQKKKLRFDHSSPRSKAELALKIGFFTIDTRMPLFQIRNSASSKAVKLVMAYQDTPVGIAFARVLLRNVERDMSEFSIFVHVRPDCRRQGIGSQLIEELITRHALDRSKLVAMDPDRPANLPFWTKNKITVRDFKGNTITV